MITRLAQWWLRRHGYHVLPYSFTGVVLGYCDAVGTKKMDNMRIFNPSCHLMVLNHSTYHYDENP